MSNFNRDNDYGINSVLAKLDEAIDQASAGIDEIDNEVAALMDKRDQLAQSVEAMKRARTDISGANSGESKSSSGSSEADFE